MKKIITIAVIVLLCSSMMMEEKKSIYYCTTRTNVTKQNPVKTAGNLQGVWTMIIDVETNSFVFKDMNYDAVDKTVYSGVITNYIKDKSGWHIKIEGCNKYVGAAIDWSIDDAATDKLEVLIFLYTNKSYVYHESLEKAILF